GYLAALQNLFVAMKTSCIVALIGCYDKSIKSFGLWEVMLLTCSGWLYPVSILTRENKDRTVGGLITLCGA
ncbi:MAG: hypothetical protein QF732_05575, partial [Nitrospinaceae bacterium]|nr:hypothetical protein [Nitrospinaceae bacterium]